MNNEIGKLFEKDGLRFILTNLLEENGSYNFDVYIGRDMPFMVGIGSFWNNKDEGQIEYYKWLDFLQENSRVVPTGINTLLKEHEKYQEKLGSN